MSRPTFAILLKHFVLNGFSTVRRHWFRVSLLLQWGIHFHGYIVSRMSSEGLQIARTVNKDEKIFGSCSTKLKIYLASAIKSKELSQCQNNDVLIFLKPLEKVYYHIREILVAENAVSSEHFFMKWRTKVLLNSEVDRNEGTSRVELKENALLPHRHSVGFSILSDFTVLTFNGTELMIGFLVVNVLVVRVNYACSLASHLG